MPMFDPAGEFLRIAEQYRRMRDEELIVLSCQTSELTDLARQALASEISQRRLNPQLKAPPLSEPIPDFSPFPDPSQHEFDKLSSDQLSSDVLCPDEGEPDEPDPYEEDRKLVELCKVWSLPDALQVEMLLDRAGIPFFMGKEKATGVDQVASSFANGMSVQIMQIGMPWALQAMTAYSPSNEPPPKPEELPAEVLVRCPKCHSTGVIFDRLLPRTATANDDSPLAYKWICDACLYSWEDDGVA